MKRHERGTGFTIVELLIVIVIIGILAAITIVAYNGIQERARMSAAMSSATQIARSPDILNAVGYYDFEQGSGAPVLDRSEKANTGTVTGTATYSTDTPSGAGRSFSFNGSTRINTTISLQPSYYLKAAWVKPTGGCNNIISASNGSSDAFYLPSCRVNAGHNGYWAHVTDSVALNDGKWHHLALEFTQTSSTVGTLKLWRDGSVVATNTNAPLPTGLDLTTPVIGAYGAGNFYSGLMDDVIIITR